MAKFQLEDEIYTTRLWISPGITSKRSMTDMKVEDSFVNNRYECIRGLRTGVKVFELFFHPYLPMEGIKPFYDYKTGILQLNYGGELLLQYELPSGYALVEERFKIR